MEVKAISTKEDLRSARNLYIYGAAASGKKIVTILEKWGIEIAGFIDDDLQKQASGFEGWKVFSLSDIFFGGGEEQNPHIIIGSIYYKTILKNIEKKNFVQKNVCIYDMRNMILEDDIRISKQFIKHKDKRFVDENYRKLYDICVDTCSRSVLDVLKRVYDEQYVGMDIYDDICSDEPQYFPSIVRRAIGNRAINLIDGGACKGEILGDICKAEVKAGYLHMFEIEDANFGALKNNVKQSHYSENVILNKSGLWSVSGKIYMSGEGDQCKIVPYETEKSISVISIDEYMASLEEREKIDMIKMDIEGSELPALKGAVKTILSDRPILAICIYHSPDDFVSIPIFLDELLDEYEFRILHHTVVYVESILYAIPKERLEN